jgi:hypothetical protein
VRDNGTIDLRALSNFQPAAEHLDGKQLKPGAVDRYRLLPADAERFYYERARAEVAAATSERERLKARQAHMTAALSQAHREDRQEHDRTISLLQAVIDAEQDHPARGLPEREESIKRLTGELETLRRDGFEWRPSASRRKTLETIGSVLQAGARRLPYASPEAPKSRPSRWCWCVNCGGLFWSRKVIREPPQIRLAGATLRRELESRGVYGSAIAGGPPPECPGCRRGRHWRGARLRACAAPGCEHLFTPSSAAHRYCSDACRKAASRTRG